jgi:diphthine-ammonia ligase
MNMKNIALSWSGGKDGCMALDKLVKQGFHIACLVTTVPKEMGRTFAHGEKTELIELQGEALNVPVHFIECTFDHYTESFIDSLKMLKRKYHLEAIAFGDLYMDDHREWGEKTARSSGLDAIYPLWMKQSEALQALDAFVKSGYQAKVIRVRNDVLDDAWLGREVNDEFLRDIVKKDVCPMGEAGEYHTFVYDGPLFKKRIKATDGKVFSYENSSRLELEDGILIDKN